MKKSGLMICLMVLVLLTGCEYIKGNVQNAGAAQEVITAPSNGRYKVVNQGNTVTVVFNEQDVIFTTEYVFGLEELSDIVTTIEYSSADTAEKIYDQIQSDEVLTQQYSKMELDNEKIILTVNRSIVSSFSSVLQDHLYQAQLKKYKYLLEY